VLSSDRGWEAASAVYVQLRQTQDELGEPVCAYGPFEAERIQEISQFAGLEFPDRTSERWGARCNDQTETQTQAAQETARS
jgi:hypothetical protein